MRIESIPTSQSVRGEMVAGSEQTMCRRDLYHHHADRDHPLSDADAVGRPGSKVTFIVCFLGTAAETPPLTMRAQLWMGDNLRVPGGARERVVDSVTTSSHAVLAQRA